MNIETDIMAQMVRQERLDRLARHVEAQLRETVLEAVLCDLVQLVQRDAGRGAAERDAGALRGEDGAVQVFLCAREDPVHGPRARDVRYVAAVFAAGVDEDQIIFPGWLLACRERFQG